MLAIVASWHPAPISRSWKPVSIETFERLWRRSIPLFWIGCSAYPPGNGYGRLPRPRPASRASVVSHPDKADLDALIEALTEGGVELIVIDGAAAVIHGSPTTTLDLDIVHRRTPENFTRLLGVLERLDAQVRDPGGRVLLPTAELLDAGGQLQLSTSLGPLDLLGKLHDGRGYEELLHASDWVTDGALRLRVLDLRTLIEIKSSAGRSKDRLVLPVLMALLRRRQGD